MFTKPAYKTVVAIDITATAGQTTFKDTCMFEFPYPPQYVIAEVNDEDTECLVKWGLPSGPYEMFMTTAVRNFWFA